MTKNQSQCPAFMREHIFERFFPVRAEKIDSVWHTLNLRESFVKGQIFPYRVEFDSPKQEGPFQEGELNIHHGPALSVHGVIGKVQKDYRDLRYFYGSYVLSVRWIRPVQLEFFREKNGIRLKLRSYVRPWILPFWNLGNTIFWKFLGITFLF
ncbi:hypothetical protein K2X05_00085 [bacterium]|nr:hypothetical protein [bacterium]